MGSYPPREIRVHLPASIARLVTTTPGQLRLLSFAVVAALAFLALTGTNALLRREAAARAVGLQTEPLLLGAEDLYVSLADADATAARTFLHSGLEPASERERYVGDIRTSGERIAAVGSQVGTSPEQLRTVQTITGQLPIYDGFVEEARANNRQGFPVGANYLNQASSLMRNQMLAEVTNLYEEATRRLASDYRAGTSPIEPVILTIIGVGAIGLLLWSQHYLNDRTNRVFNVGLLAATLLIAGMLCWSLLRLYSENRELVSSRRDGADAVQVLTAARILLLRAESDDSLALIAHGTGDAFVKDFDNATSSLVEGTDGENTVLLQALTSRHQTKTADPIAGNLQALVATFMTEHERVRQLDDTGRYQEAVTVSLTDESSAAQALDSELGKQIALARAQMDAHAKNARAGFEMLIIALPAAIALAAVSSLIGLQQRIAEYDG
jgi:hypothetical protein